MLGEYCFDLGALGHSCFFETHVSKPELNGLQVRQYLVEDRRPYLEAVKEGFWALNLADHLEHFCGVELASLFFGEQYVDVDRLIGSLCMEQGEEEQTTRDWLHRFVKALSEHSVRVFLARVANRLTLSTAGQTITVEVCSDIQQPRFFPVASHMQLPVCASYDVFAARMNAAFRLGEYMMRTDAQHEERLTREEERAVAQERSDLAGITNVVVAIYMPLVSVVDLCSKQPVLGVAAILGGLHIAWQAVMRMLALMVLEHLPGLSDVFKI